jgi:hypothetical protein
MAKNSSPKPRFETDENYNYFITTLPVDPAFQSDDEIDEGVNIVDNQKNKIANLVRDGIVERYIRILRKKDIIAYRGSKKTGGKDRAGKDK